MAARVSVLQVDCRAKSADRVQVDLAHLAVKPSILPSFAFERHEQSLVIESDRDAARNRANDSHVFLTELFARQLLRKENQAHQLTAGDHWDGNPNAQTPQQIGVTVEEVNEFVLLAIDQNRPVEFDKSFSFVPPNHNSVADHFRDSSSSDDLKLTSLACVSRDSPSPNHQGAKQGVKRRASDLLEIVRRADFCSQLGQRAEVVQ